MRTFDQIIDANMTVTDQLLRQAIHGVMVDLLYEVRESCAKICDNEEYGEIDSHFTDGYNHGVRACAAAIRGEEE